jgi:hypothetical protein
MQIFKYTSNEDVVVTAHQMFDLLNRLSQLEAFQLDELRDRLVNQGTYHTQDPLEKGATILFKQLVDCYRDRFRRPDEPSEQQKLFRAGYPIA